MKKYILVFLCSFVFANAFAQDKVFKMTPQDTIVPKVKEEKAPKQNTADIGFKKIVGGNVWFNVWGSYYYFDISPVAAYKLNEKTHLGVGATYRYVSGYSYSSGLSSDYSVYGGRVFMRYMLFPSIFAHAEYEYMYGLPIPVLRGSSYFAERSWVAGTLIGGSYRSMMGERTASTLTILYNATHVTNVTPYTSPLVIRLSFEYEF
jgi:hypothetical protein